MAKKNRAKSIDIMGVVKLAGSALAGTAVSMVGAEVAGALVENVHAQRVAGLGVGVAASHILLPMIGSDEKEGMGLAFAGDAGAVTGFALPYIAPKLDEAGAKLRAMLTKDGASASGGSSSTSTEAQGDAYDDMVQSSRAFSGVA